MRRSMSEAHGTLPCVSLVDVFDLIGAVLPRKVSRLLVVTLLLLPGGAFVNWYVQEKTAGYQEVMTELLEDLFDGLLPANNDTPDMRGTEAV